ncbi:phosphate ABC transporter substrate-binding protein [Paraglaciecola aquimarina]|uniref:Phosphate ABC transporter substrate-binding protein n=1 Tax=Paraglaciecola aquimarina TaxID=1235557 RepID=A0ABU3STW0_9ALTE|nr:phosphate ABC transporter substrate-binding protein [Paraglaciecola aquimarina]MDU0353441.1 phosphate ABC transporter substrate-binding protein [Paraglaciecola aquimarina]
MNIKTLYQSAIATTLGCTLAFSSLAEVVLVVHPNNDSSLDTKMVKRIFLGKASKFSNGNEATPVNQLPSSASRVSFDSDTLGRSSSQVSAYWSKLVFTGKGIPPEELENDAAVIAFVASNENAVGYVNSSAVTSSVKAIPLN